jgi:hypothetical protein
MTLHVMTEKGLFQRTIMPATLLGSGEPLGAAAETATRSAAATWGMPDFVFRSAISRRGAATRELGDAILISGERAACVQVKARAALSGDIKRERAWLDKKIAEGARQGLGTIKNMRHGRPTLVNERGHAITIDGSPKKWLAITVLDHPGLGDYTPSGDSVVLLRQDWEFLFEQLKSTYAVLEYLERVGNQEPIALGTEPVRYYELAAADLRSTPEPLDPRLAALGHHGRSTPLLPMAPAAYGEIIRGMLEDIASCDMPAQATSSTVLDVLAAIDAAPVGYRAELGRDVLTWLDGMSDVPPGEVRWQFRRLTWPKRPHLIFGAAPRFTETIQEAFELFVQLRHQQHLEITPERTDLLTVGILLTPRHDGRRPWDTTLAATIGEQGLEPGLRSALEDLWGPFGTRDQPGFRSS